MIGKKTVERMYIVVLQKGCEAKAYGLDKFAQSRYTKQALSAGVVQRLVHQPSKLRTWVRLPSPAPKENHRGKGLTVVRNHSLAGGAENGVTIEVTPFSAFKGRFCN